MIPPWRRHRRVHLHHEPDFLLLRDPAPQQNLVRITYKCGCWVDIRWGPKYRTRAVRAAGRPGVHRGMEDFHEWVLERWDEQRAANRERAAREMQEGG